MHEYVGTAVLAEIWDVTPATVSKWCREGKILGAEQDRPGSPWRIPVDAQKPERIRRK